MWRNQGCRANDEAVLLERGLTTKLLGSTMTQAHREAMESHQSASLLAVLAVCCNSKLSFHFWASVWSFLLVSGVAGVAGVAGGFRRAVVFFAW